MTHFLVTYEYYMRPIGRKGRRTTQTLTFSAHDRTEALVLAKDHGKQIFNRRRWKIVDCRVSA